MGVTKKLYKSGNGVDQPKTGDLVTIDYTGWLYDPKAGPDSDYRGTQ
jgi:FK506-binding protein 1